MASVSGGRYHFSAILDDGTVVSWGDNTHGQASAPAMSAPVSQVDAGYYATYAIDENGNVSSWGLDGYLMGTDNLGRDIFRRLLVGGRMTMTVGAIAVVISTFIGILVGGISAAVQAAVQTEQKGNGQVVQAAGPQEGSPRVCCSDQRAASGKGKRSSPSRPLRRSSTQFPSTQV